MARKQVSTEFKQLKKGDKVEGYLLTVSEQVFPPKTPGAKESVVPTLVLQDKTGKRFKVLLGTTVREDVNLLATHAYTWISKAKEDRETRGGNRVIEYTLEQDADDILRG